MTSRAHIWKAGGIGASFLALASCVHTSQGLNIRREPQSTVPAEVRGLTPEEQLGRAIWYNATAANSRYHAYAFGQRVMGRKIKWGKLFKSDERDTRFSLWGLINDPGCCKVTSAEKERENCCQSMQDDPAALPGDFQACKDATLASSYGLDFCAGDSELLPYVGRVKSREGVAYNDARLNPEGKTPYKLDQTEPACDLARFVLGESGGRDKSLQRQDSCDLDFGTSVGVLGYRKFPNPRFDARRWQGWSAWEARPDDHSVEPPFLIGLACGACHIGLNPALPPRDSNHPTWDNIRGLVGNQFVRNAVVLGSGVQPDPKDKGPSTLEWEEFAHERPGATDTSAIPNDQISNPGTMNAIIATQLRPHSFRERVKTWYREGCGSDVGTALCWEDPGFPGKTWHWRENRPGNDKHPPDDNYNVYHILKGGEDTIGAAGAVMRVYINIGSCAEACWLNHLTDLRVFSPNERNYGQTPFDIGQCRRDCPAYRAVEDRVGAVFSWLKSAQPIPLVAKGQQGYEVVAREATEEMQDKLKSHLAALVTPENVEAGRKLFITNCAGCHSSVQPVKEDTTFQNNWMSSDELIPQSVVKTYECRAKHSNHLEGQIWSEFSSIDRQSKGVGYYKIPSLLDAWAFAPFGHNNAIGPEVCSRAEEVNRPEEKWYVSPYKDGGECTPYPETVLERFELFEKSLEELLNPSERKPKVTLTDREIDFPLFGALSLGAKERVSGAVLRLPSGLPVSLTGSFRHKDWIQDFFLFIRDKKGFLDQVGKRWGPSQAESLAKLFEGTRSMLMGKDGTEVDRDRRRVLRVNRDAMLAFMKSYSGCKDEVENAGHTFGEELGKDETQRRQLAAFLATL